jgi:hypothetical protein
VLSSGLSARSPDARVGAFAAYALVMLAQIALPLHADAIASAIAGVSDSGPGYSASCNQASAGAEVECDLSAPAPDEYLAEAISSASASFGDLSVAATAGSTDWDAGARASASFNSDVIFSQTGMITGTWLINYDGGGDEGYPTPDIQIMGTDVYIPYDPEESGGSGSFDLPITFTYSGVPIDISVAISEEAGSPGGEGANGSVQLVGFSSDYTVLPDAPEPGTLWLTGIAVSALALFRRSSHRFLS